MTLQLKFRSIVSRFLYKAETNSRFQFQRFLWCENAASTMYQYLLPFLVAAAGTIGVYYCYFRHPTHMKKYETTFIEKYGRDGKWRNLSRKIAFLYPYTWKCRGSHYQYFLLSLWLLFLRTFEIHNMPSTWHCGGYPSFSFRWKWRSWSNMTRKCLRDCCRTLLQNKPNALEYALSGLFFFHVYVHVMFQRMKNWWNCRQNWTMQAKKCYSNYALIRLNCPPRINQSKIIISLVFEPKYTHRFQLKLFSVIGRTG